jgi:phosphatidate cytidylyltransferase
VRSNLRTRVATALVLATVLIGVLATGSTALWAALVTCFCFAAAWEFLRLATGVTKTQKLVAFALLAALIAVFAFEIFAGFAANGFPLLLIKIFLLVAALFWVVGVPLQLARRWVILVSWGGVLTMPVVIGAAWLSAVLLQRAGTWFLIAVVVITVAADVAAYFVGRAFGRVKLAPLISPGKTREGALGGIAAAALWATLMAATLGLGSGLLSLFVAALAGAFLGACAVMGDLWESQLKRQAGVKDSSQLLPGHGGVLDRIDAHLAVLPLATVLLNWVKPLW